MRVDKENEWKASSLVSMFVNLGLVLVLATTGKRWTTIQYTVHNAN